MVKHESSKFGYFHYVVKLSLDFIEYLGLLVIACATTYAGWQEIIKMIERHQVTLADLLLLFLYLEVLAMVGIYFRTGQLPVRFPLYIAMVAIARHIIIDLKAMTDLQLLAGTLSIVILSVAVLLVRYGHARFPYHDAVGLDEEGQGVDRKKMASSDHAIVSAAPVADSTQEKSQ